MTDLKVHQSRIKKLSSLLINQLSAGEVVTRPASVVKELLENAIDAGASKITVNITQGGMGLIEVIDNGCGIHPDDMLMAVTRHATSKVADVEQLQGIETLGFRGEALASISAVSRLTVTSSVDDSGVGRCLMVAGKIENPEITPVVCKQGTTIAVQDLYFNVPARRNNLKSVAKEYTYIETVVREIALAYANIEIHLNHEGKRRIELSAIPKSVDVLGRVLKNQHTSLIRLIQAWNGVLPNPAYPIDIDLSTLTPNNEWAEIKGWLWLMDDENNQQLTKNVELPRLIYVNHRLVKDLTISQKMRKTMQSMGIGLQEFGYALFFNLPIDWLNLNIHPSKQRISIHALTNINTYLHHGIVQVLKYALQERNIEQGKHKIHEKLVTSESASKQNSSIFLTQSKQQQHKYDDNTDQKLSKSEHSKNYIHVSSPESIYHVDNFANSLGNYTSHEGDKQTKQLQLMLVVESSDGEKQVEKLAKLICRTLGCAPDFFIEEYQQLKDSYQIEITLSLEANDGGIVQMIELSDRICQPWMVHYHREMHSIELNFNSSNNTQYQDEQFSIIQWATFSVLF